MATGVFIGLVAGVGLYAFVRQFGNLNMILLLGIAQGSPKTVTPEWEKASEEYARRQNGNPLSGISSKPRKEPKDLEL